MEPHKAPVLILLGCHQSTQAWGSIFKFRCDIYDQRVCDNPETILPVRNKLIWYIDINIDSWIIYGVTHTIQLS